MSVLIVFACVLLAAAHAVEFGPLPGDRKLCIVINEHSRNDVLALRIKQFVQYALDNAERGLPEYNIPPLEPLVDPRSRPATAPIIEGKLNMALTTRNVVSYGWKNSQVEDVQVTGSGNIRQVRLLIRIPKLDFTDGTWIITSPVHLTGRIITVAYDGEFVLECEISKHGVSDRAVQSTFKKVINNPPNTFPDMPTTLRLLMQEYTNQILSDLLLNAKDISC